MKNTNTKSGIDVKNLYRFFQFFLHIDNFFIDCISKCSVTGCIQMLESVVLEDAKAEASRNAA